MLYIICYLVSGICFIISYYISSHYISLAITVSVVNCAFSAGVGAWRARWMWAGGYWMVFWVVVEDECGMVGGS